MEHQSISTRIVHQKAHRLPPSIAPGSSMSSASLCRSSMKQTQASCGSMRASIDAPQAINRMTTKVGWEGWGILRLPVFADRREAAAGDSQLPECTRGCRRAGHHFVALGIFFQRGARGAGAVSSSCMAPFQLPRDTCPGFVSSVMMRQGGNVNRSPQGSKQTPSRTSLRYSCNWIVPGRGRSRPEVSLLVVGGPGHGKGGGCSTSRIRHVGYQDKMRRLWPTEMRYNYVERGHASADRTRPIGQSPARASGGCLSG